MKSKKIENIARICHEANRAYCFTLGDISQLSWESAPDWQKESAINGVKFHLEKERHPSESHENWLIEKKNDGWSYGPVKDPNKKEHPCFLSYKELPLEQQIKDYIFSYIVKAFKDAEQDNK